MHGSVPFLSFPKAQDGWPVLSAAFVSTRMCGIQDLSPAPPPPALCLYVAGLVQGLTQKLSCCFQLGQICVLDLHCSFLVLSRRPVILLSDRINSTAYVSAWDPAWPQPPGLPCPAPGTPMAKRVGYSLNHHTRMQTQTQAHCLFPF